MSVATPSAFVQIMETIAMVGELVGVAIIVVGAVATTFLFLKRMLADRDARRAYRLYRGELGRSILLGLEFLVAADIIGTVAVHPTFRDLGVLGLLIVIRTFLSFALEVEITGHWPWQESVLRAKLGRVPMGLAGDDEGDGTLAPPATDDAGSGAA